MRKGGTGLRQILGSCHPLKNPPILSSMSTLYIVHCTGPLFEKTTPQRKNLHVFQQGAVDYAWTNELNPKCRLLFKTDLLKVPKRENFSLAFFALSEPIWVCDLGTGEKNRIFYQLAPDFDGF
jgi:hypothetical protein